MAKQDFIHCGTQVYFVESSRILVNRDLLTIPRDQRGDVTFTYLNTRTGKESEKPGFTYEQALALAERRSCDGRYRNFIFIID